jgi:hypothetical protein
MRRFGLVALVSFFTMIGTAHAQSAPPTPGADNNGKPLNLQRNRTGDAAAETARARARAGDCAGALPEFDEALKSSHDVELIRDRGICHDKLGNRYPALEDLRAYVAARPEAADAEAIRQRVAALEGAVDNKRELKNTARADSAGAETDVDVYAANRGEGAAQLHNEPIGAKAGEQEKDYGYYKEQERLNDEAKDSALRYGHGVILGVQVGIPKYYFGKGGVSDWAYRVNGRLGYAFNTYFAAYAELGLVGIGKSGDLTSFEGPMLGLGAEVKIPLTARATDQLFLRLAFEYEHYILNKTRAVSNSVPAQFSFGYRRILGKAVGLEIMADGGPVMTITEGGDTSFGGLVGGSVAFVVGF